MTEQQLGKCTGIGCGMLGSGSLDVSFRLDRLNTTSPSGGVLYTLSLHSSDNTRELLTAAPSLRHTRFSRIFISKAKSRGILWIEAKKRLFARQWNEGRPSEQGVPRLIVSRLNGDFGAIDDGAARPRWGFHPTSFPSWLQTQRSPTTSFTPNSAATTAPAAAPKSAQAQPSSNLTSAATTLPMQTQAPATPRSPSTLAETAPAEWCWRALVLATTVTMLRGLR